MMLAAIRMSATQISAATERDCRESPKLRRPHISIGLFEVDDDRVGGEKRNHDRDEIQEVAQIDDAAGDCGEMPDDAGPGDGVDKTWRSPVAEKAKHYRGPRGNQHEDQRR